jgi:hypothetical protein
MVYYLLIYLKVLPVLFSTEHHAMKAYWGNGGIEPCIPNLGTKWR